MNSVDNHSPTSITAPVRSEDKRAAELEELRKKQLATTWNIVDENTGGGGGQPIAMDTWFEKQREQTKLNKLQQKDATDNLRNFKSVINPTSTAAGNGVVGNVRNVKDEMKQKRQEATAMLNNYRGQPEVFMTHQVKKHSKAGVTNKNIVQVDVVPRSTSSPVKSTEKKQQEQQQQQQQQQQQTMSEDRDNTCCTVKVDSKKLHACLHWQGTLNMARDVSCATLCMWENEMLVLDISLNPALGRFMYYIPVHFLSSDWN